MTESFSADTNKAVQGATDAQADVPVPQFGIRLEGKDISLTLEELKDSTVLQIDDAKAGDLNFVATPTADQAQSAHPPEAWRRNTPEEKSLVGYFAVHVNDIAVKVMTQEEIAALLNAENPQQSPPTNKRGATNNLERQQLLLALRSKLPELTEELNRRGIYFKIGENRNPLPYVTAALDAANFELGKELAHHTERTLTQTSYEASDPRRRRLYSEIKMTPDREIKLTGDDMSAVEPTLHFEVNGKKFEFSLIDLSHLARQTLQAPTEENKKHFATLMDILEKEYPAIDGLESFKKEVLDTTSSISGGDLDDRMKDFSFPIPGKKDPTWQTTTNILARIIDADSKGPNRIIPEIVPTVQVDLEAAQAMMMAYIPAEARVKLRALQMSRSPEDKEKYFAERRLWMRALLESYNVQPEGGMPTLDNPQDQLVDDMKGRIAESRKRQVSLQRPDGSYVSQDPSTITVLNANRLGLYEELKAYCVAVDQAGADALPSLDWGQLEEGLATEATSRHKAATSKFKEEMRLHLSNPDQYPVPKKPGTERNMMRQILEERIVNILPSSLRANDLVQNIIKDHVNTELKLNPDVSPEGARFEKLSGFKTKNQNLIAVQQMGLKGIELLYRRAQSTKNITPGNDSPSLPDAFDAANASFAIRSIVQQNPDILPVATESQILALEKHLEETKDFKPKTYQELIDELKKKRLALRVMEDKGADGTDRKATYQKAQHESVQTWKRENQTLINEGLVQAGEAQLKEPPEQNRSHFTPEQQAYRIAKEVEGLRYIWETISSESGYDLESAKMLLGHLAARLSRLNETDRDQHPQIVTAYEQLKLLTEQVAGGTIFSVHELKGKTKDELISMGIINASDEKYTAVAGTETVSDVQGLIFQAEGYPVLDDSLTLTFGDIEVIPQVQKTQATVNRLRQNNGCANIGGNLERVLSSIGNMSSWVQNKLRR